MKNFTRFLIPLGLGAAAFVFNWMAVKPQLGRDYVVVSQEVDLEAPLSEDNIAKFTIVKQDFEELKKTLVPWEERASLIGVPVRRKLQSGDLVFWQDVRFVSADFLPADDEVPLHVPLKGIDYEPSLLKVGNLVGIVVPIAPPVDTSVEPVGDPLTRELAAQFEELGPFRILSVGRRTLSAPGESEGGQTGAENVLTLAVKLDPPKPGTKLEVSKTGRRGSLPEAARKLLAAQGIERSDGRNIVAMVLYQDVDRLERLRAGKAAETNPAAPTATGTGPTTSSVTSKSN